MSPPLRNAHISYSRIARFEQCPLAYRFHYLERLTPIPTVALGLGKLVHAVLEHLVREHMLDERTGGLSVADAERVYGRLWASSGLSGAGLFAEGLALVRAGVRAEGAVDHRAVLAVEQEFRLAIGRFTLLGFIDRVDLLDERTAHVVDYKTNRLLFTDEQLAESLQMSVYALAVRQLWPWVERVEMSFVMLRHGRRQSTTRTADELADAAAYVEAVAEQMERAKVFPPHLNPNCPYCDFRDRCPAYARVLTGQDIPPRDIALSVEDAADHWHTVSTTARIAYGRKRELEAGLVAHLVEAETLEAGTRTLRLLEQRTPRFAPADVLDFLGGLTGRARETLLAEVCVVDREKLDQAFDEAVAGRPAAEVRMLRAQLDALAHEVVTQRLIAHERKG